MNGARRLAVDVVATLTHAVVEPLLRRTSAPIGAAVVYHRLATAPADRGRYFVRPLDASRFEQDLRFLTQTYLLVPASRLHAAVRDRRRGERIPVAITFDDDDSSYRELALPLLSAYDAPATFFLGGVSLDEPHQFWWEALDEAAEHGELDVERLLEELGLAAGALGTIPTTLGELADIIRGLQPDRRLEVDRRAAERLGADARSRGLDRAAVHDLVERGHEIGFHTLRHLALTTLDGAELDRELRSGRAKLEAVAGRPCTAIAYPYGDADGRVAQAAEASGFDVGFTLHDEPVTSRTSPLLTGRVQPSYVSTRVLSARVILALARGSLRARSKTTPKRDPETSPQPRRRATRLR